MVRAQPADHNKIESRVQFCKVRSVRKCPLQGAGDAQPLAGRDRTEAGFQIRSILYLDRNKGIALSGEDIDFTDRCFVTPFDNAVSLQPQP